MPRILRPELQAVHTALEPLRIETELAFKSLALAAFYDLSTSNPAMDKMYRDRYTKRLGSVKAHNPENKLSNGATVREAWLITGRSLYRPWPHTAKRVEIFTGSDALVGWRGVSSEGTVYNVSSDNNTNPIGKQIDGPHSRFITYKVETTEDLRRACAITYAGAVAIGSYVSEALSVGFGIDTDRAVFGHLYDEWMNGGVSNALGIEWPLARFLGSEIVGGIAERPPTLL